MAVSGMPEDKSNVRNDPCGCELVRVALPGNPWRYLKRCDEHPKVNAEGIEEFLEGLEA